MTIETRHPAWLAERMKLFTHANALPDEGEAYDSACTAMQVLERQILDTPVANQAEALAKLQMAAAIHAEGMMLDADAAAELISEVTPYLAGEK